MKLFLAKPRALSAELRQKEASAPVRLIPPPRVLSEECRREIRTLFPSKSRLLLIISFEVLYRWTWEAHHWPVLSPWVPDPETKEKEEERKKTGRPRTGKIIPSEPSPNLLGCVSWKLIAPQLEKIRPIVLLATTPDEIIERIEKEVEIL